MSVYIAIWEGERESLLKAIDSCSYGGCQVKVQVPQGSILNINKRRRLPSLGPNMPPKVTSEVCDRAKSIPVQSRKSPHAHLSPCSAFCFLEQLLGLLPLIFFGKCRWDCLEECTMWSRRTKTWAFQYCADRYEAVVWGTLVARWLLWAVSF